MTIYSLHPQGLFISYPFFINSSFSFPYSLLSLHFHLTVSISLLGLSSELFASGNISLTLILYRTYLGERCALLIPMPASLMTVFPTILWATWDQGPCIFCPSLYCLSTWHTMVFQRLVEWRKRSMK